MRGWQWNNAWFISQERPVTNIGMKESLQQRNIPCYQAQELLTPLSEDKPSQPVEIVETVMKKMPHDETHPLWQVLI